MVHSWYKHSHKQELVPRYMTRKGAPVVREFEVLL